MSRAFDGESGHSNYALRSNRRRYLAPGADLCRGRQRQDERRPGRRRRWGGPGQDTINVADVGSGDRALGGLGNDSCVIDASDTVHGCESVTVVP